MRLGGSRARKDGAQRPSRTARPREPRASGGAKDPFRRHGRLWLRQGRRFGKSSEWREPLAAAATAQNVRGGARGTLTCTAAGTAATERVEGS